MTSRSSCSSLSLGINGVIVNGKSHGRGIPGDSAAAVGPTTEAASKVLFPTREKYPTINMIPSHQQ